MSPSSSPARQRRPVWRADAWCCCTIRSVRAKPPRDPDAEARSLHAALAAARAELERLAEASRDGEVQAILEFQIAMLEDDVLTAPAFAAIEAGTPADRAWQAAMEEQIAEYRDAPDPYFRARSADLCDMRDRVLRHLAGGAQRGDPAGGDRGRSRSRSFALPGDRLGWRRHCALRRQPQLACGDAGACPRRADDRGPVARGSQPSSGGFARRRQWHAGGIPRCCDHRGLSRQPSRCRADA